jgi:hypothetical protein
MVAESASNFVKRHFGWLKVIDMLSERCVAGTAREGHSVT